MGNAATGIVNRMRRARLVGLPVVLAMFLCSAPAVAQEPTLEGVRISGDPNVGQTLTAVISGTVDPAGVAFKWCREGTRPGRCASGQPLGRSAGYVPVAGDVGSRLLVTATATVGTFTIEVKSAPTAPVAASPPPDPEPTPTPTPTPVPTPVAPATPGTTDPAPTSGTSSPAPGFTSPGVTPDAALQGAIPVFGGPAALRYMTPFPVVRIRGRLALGGARVTLLKVTAPRSAQVLVRCEGRGCPRVPRGARAPGRVRALERFLMAGTRITIRVRRPGLIGKYVRIAIRAGRPPSRRDACLLPGSGRPASCPRP